MIYPSLKPIKRRYIRTCKFCNRWFDIWKDKRPLGKLVCPECIAKRKEITIKKKQAYLKKQKKIKMLLLKTSKRKQKIYKVNIVN